MVKSLTEKPWSKLSEAEKLDQLYHDLLHIHIVIERIEAKLERLTMAVEDVGSRMPATALPLGPDDAY